MQGCFDCRSKASLCEDTLSSHQPASPNSQHARHVASTLRGTYANWPRLPSPKDNYIKFRKVKWPQNDSYGHAIILEDVFISKNAHAYVRFDEGGRFLSLRLEKETFSICPGNGLTEINSLSYFFVRY